MALHLVCHSQKTPRVDFSFNPQYEKNFDFYDQRLLDLVQAGDQQVSDFFTLLALCHTVMPEEKDGGASYLYIHLLPLRISSEWLVVYQQDTWSTKHSPLMKLLLLGLHGISASSSGWVMSLGPLGIWAPALKACISFAEPYPQFHHHWGAGSHPGLWTAVHSWLQQCAQANVSHCA